MYYIAGGWSLWSFRFSSQKRNAHWLTAYAKLHALSIGEAFKRALFEKIEDEYDVAVADDAYQDYLDSGCRSTPVEEFWKELDAEDEEV